MKRSTFVWVLSILVSITTGGLIAWNIYVPNSEVRISQAQIQTYIDGKLPQQGGNVVLSGAKLQCANNKLSTSFSLHTNEVAGHTYAVEVNVGGYPRYEAAEGSFYFEPTDVTVDSKLSSKEDQLPSAALSETESSGTLHALARAAAEKIDSVARALIRGAILNSLKEAPVYELPRNFEGATAAVLLHEVTVVDGELVFSLTLEKLGAFILIALVVVLIGIGTLRTSTRRPTFALSLAMLCLAGV